MARAVVVYESMFGNTQEIARAIADGLGSVPGMEVVTEEVGRAPALVAGADLLVVGAPTHALTLSRPATRKDAASKARGALVSAGVGVREWLEVVELAGAPPVAATFDTRIKKPLLPGSAAKAARRLLHRRGIQVVDVESFWVADLLGPLRDGEVERARRWGVGLAAGARAAA